MIFALDLDGTLITAEERQSLLLKAIAKRYCVILDASKIWRKKREGFNNIVTLSALGLDKSLARRIDIIWKDNIETPFWLSIDTLFQDTISNLQNLTRSGHQLILITARQNEILMTNQINRLGIARFFCEIYCVSPCNSLNLKSDALRRAQADCFIGDSETDFNSAKVANVPFYGVCTGQRSETFLKSIGVDSVSKTLSLAVSHFLEMQ